MSASTSHSLLSLKLTAPTSRWSGPIMSALVVLSLVLMSMQSLNDRDALEHSTATRISNENSMLAATLADQFNLIGATLMQMDELLNGPDGQLPADGGVRLKDLRSGIASVMHGAELAIFDPAGRSLAETDEFIRNGVPPLGAVMAAGRGGTSIVHTVRGDIVLVVKPHQGREGKADAMLVLAAPLAPLRQLLGKLTLLPNSTVTLLDAARRPLLQLPDDTAIPPGTVFPALSAGTTGVPRSGIQVSPIDGVERLYAETVVHLPWSASDPHWILQLGKATGEYRHAWRVSTIYNLMLGALLVAMWLSNTIARRGNRVLIGQINSSLRLLRNVLDTLPSPVALVAREDDTVGIGNSAMLERFGSLASQGEAVGRLFGKPGDWEALKQQGKADDIAMLSRHGAFQALAHCAPLDAEREAGPHYWLLTLTDITHQHNRIEHLHTAAMRDPLTGLPNRRCFAEQSAEALVEARERRHPLALLALDLDFFKRVNDTYGHAAGDRVLVVLAQVIRGALRDRDMPARLGGEEFSVLLPDAGPEQARAAAERIRMAVAATPIALDDGHVLSQTISIGISMVLPEETDLAAAQERADAALYKAKEHGRNRTEMADAP